MISARARVGDAFLDLPPSFFPPFFTLFLPLHRKLQSNSRCYYLASTPNCIGHCL